MISGAISNRVRASEINRKINLKHQGSDKSERISNLSKRLQVKEGRKGER